MSYICPIYYKTYSKKATGVDRSKRAKKVDLSGLKSEVDKVYIDTLKTVETDWSKLSDVVDDDFVKTSVYNKLVTKVIAVNHSELCKKTDCNTKIKEIEEQTFGKR